jgi:asparagine synthase (glutamine-hydrolysing)
MCGILGQISERRGDLDSWVAAEAIDALRHRGPDGEGVFEDSAGTFACRLVHTRLAIIDTSEAGRQPMRSPDGNHVLIYNGEIYNHVELRNELAQVGEQFASTSDSEVLLRAFARWGPACLERLRGMFAFAVWNTRERSLFLARDRLGIKPLYICQREGSFAFASEVRSLLRTRIAERKLSHQGLEAFLAFGSVWGGQTLIEGVQELAPGSWASFRDGVVRRGTYWTLPTSLDRSGPLTLDQAVEAVAPVLREAISLQLRSDVKLGVFLSAGLDSSTLAAIAKLQLGRPPTTLTVCVEGASGEGREAAAIASHLGSEHHEIPVSLQEAANWLPQAVAAMDQPSVDGVNTWIVARAARGAGLTVALSGLGGDEVFAGYGSFRFFSKLLGLPKAVRPVGRFATAFLNGAPFGLVPNRLRKVGWVLRNAGDPPALYGIMRAMFTREQARLFDHGHPGPTPFIAQEEGDFDAVRLLSGLELRHYLRSTLLRDTDSMSMAHGLEVRPPLLDERLCALVLSLPGRIKVGTAENKPVLLGCTRQLLPDGIGRRPKTGFDLPFDSWLSGPLREWSAEGWRQSVRLGGLEEAGYQAIAKARERKPGSLSWHRWFGPAVLGHWLSAQRVERR